MDRATFHKLLAFGVERQVSDIHFEVGYPPHYRLHGELLGAIKVQALAAADTEDIARMILEDRGAAPVDFTRPFREIDVSYALAQRGRFRVSIFRQRGFVGVVMRLVPVDVAAIADLNLPAILGEIADARRGLILVTGATGNGKSTTIAAMVRHINESRHAHVVTIEDPIEFVHEPKKCMIIQREVGADTESFGEAVGAAMRQDPDVIVVGEIRDAATAAAALRGAETGHLVIAAIHTPDAVATFQRYVGLFETGAHDAIRERLADALQAVISLRLVTARDNRRRLPAVEIMRVTRTIREALRHKDRLGEVPDLIRKGRDVYQMQLFDQHLLALVKSGLISIETATFAASSAEQLERAMQVE